MVLMFLNGINNLVPGNGITSGLMEYGHIYPRHYNSVIGLEKDVDTNDVVEDM